MPSRPRRELLPYLLLAPAIACELVVHVVPTLVGLFLSFHRVDEFNLRDWATSPGAGTGNYKTALDPGTSVGSALWSSFGTTLAFTALVVGLCWAIGMFAAVLLSQPFRGRALFRTLFLVPFALPAYVTAIGWRFMFDRDDGAVNHLLVDNLHVAHSHPFWLVGGHAFWATVVVSVWRLWPFAFLMLLAALTTVPQERYEAAALNGARPWAQFWHVTLPGIRRVNTLVLGVLVLWAFNEFTVPFVLLGSTPPQSATLVSTLVYREAFGTFQVGVAAATNVALAVLLFVVGLLWLARRRSVDA
ncbi:MAG TPA: sugar ABC transporter permease [Marmoricola sp.]|nr:sugar ABC transporter permease [Marmoricola sp.]